MMFVGNLFWGFGDVFLLYLDLDGLGGGGKLADVIVKWLNLGLIRNYGTCKFA